jgi:hypothetical protein
VRHERRSGSDDGITPAQHRIAISLSWACLREAWRGSTTPLRRAPRGRGQ